MRSPSPWFADFLNGDLQALDNFLDSVELGAVHVQSLPDPAEITQPPSVVGVSERHRLELEPGPLPPSPVPVDGD